MDNVIVAFESEVLSQRVATMLERAGIANCLLCHSLQAVRDILREETIYCVVSGISLCDGPAVWLYDDLPPACTLVMVGPQKQLDTCQSRDLIKLSTPMDKNITASTVSLALQFGHRIERLSQPQHDDAEQDEIQRAKILLMHHQALCEADAHRELQQRSMYSGSRVIDTARRVIKSLEG